MDITNLVCHDALALLANEHEQLENVGLVNFRDALDARHAVTLKDHAKDCFGLLDGQVLSVQGVIARICEHLAALGTLVALAVLALAEFTAFGTAGMAGHCEISY
ncbi:MAG: hypothetical protein ABI833_23655 [Acidobacteriota bacterium]